MVFSGLSPDGRLVEIAELETHPFMLGSQFHPEFKSRPNRPHPLFKAFLAAVVAHQNGRSPATNGAAPEQAITEEKLSPAAIAETGAE